MNAVTAHCKLHLTLENWDHRQRDDLIGSSQRMRVIEHADRQIGTAMFPREWGSNDPTTTVRWRSSETQVELQFRRKRPGRRAHTLDTADRVACPPPKAGSRRL